MIRAAADEVKAAGIEQPIEVAVADAGYWKGEQIDNLAANGIQVLVPPDGHANKRGNPSRRGGRYEFMRRVLASDKGRELYRQRMQTIEPVFGHTKHNRRAERFQRRGLAACRSEWRLIAATHNLLKLWRATTATAPA